MDWIHEQDTPAVPDSVEIFATWVGVDGWKVIIRKKHIGQPWERVVVERYKELDPLELLTVIDSVLGRWLTS